MNSTLEKNHHFFSYEKLLNEGVCVFKKFISETQTKQLKKEINVVREIVMAKIATMERPLKTYTDIAERHLGRLDYRCGFHANIFNEVANAVEEIINKTSPLIDFRHYWGLVTSLPGSAPTDLHRDVYPILNTTQGQNLDNFNINLPPYYFTVLIPLVEITKENGPTEFIKFSKDILLSDDADDRSYAPLLSLGDLVIFDGRTLHRGLANHTQTERVVAYITFVANWYNDQTFVINDYLFPELAVKGK